MAGAFGPDYQIPMAQKVGSQWKQFPVLSQTLTTEVNIHQEPLVLSHTPRFTSQVS